MNGLLPLITEAEKYLGYPYVWGGSSPETSFDCSGFVSYVLTSTGLCNTGRLGAQGGFTISPRRYPTPSPVIWCSLWAPMTPAVSPMWVFMWATE